VTNIHLVQNPWQNASRLHKREHPQVANGQHYSKSFSEFPLNSREDDEFKKEFHLCTGLYDRRGEYKKADKGVDEERRDICGNGLSEPASEVLSLLLNDEEV